LEAALGERVGVSDNEWALIGPLLPPEYGRGCRPAGDDRPYFEGMMWMARTGAQWRRLPDEYGEWNSVFDAMLETLSEMVECDTSAGMIDSTVVRAHHCAVGLKSPKTFFSFTASMTRGSRYCAGRFGGINCWRCLAALSRA
jgi:transposase